MPILATRVSSPEDQRASYLLQLLDAEMEVIPTAHLTVQELHIIRDKARAELATLLRKDFLAEKPTVAAGGYHGS